jgi:hypothetical protein
MKLRKSAKSEVLKVNDKTHETLAMLKLLAMTGKENPEAKGIKETFNELRKELNQ